MNTTPDSKKLEAFLGQMVTDLGAAASGVLVVLGDRLGIYEALDRHGPATSAQLAEATNLDERYLREWLSNQAASGYVDYDSASGEFSLGAEQRAVLADKDSPFHMTGGFYSIASLYNDAPKFEKIFASGEGLPWADHHDCLFCGTAKFFRPNYAGHLVQDWIPALNGTAAKLESGAKVADVGCGHGCSTLIMGRAFPNSEFIGFDSHPASIEEATRSAREEGLGNVRFEVAAAKDYPGNDYDMVACFDCLHDMGDPAGASKHVRASLKPEGSWMIVEPMAGDSLADNLNPVGRVYYAFSSTVCVPASRSQEVGLGLGAQAGERRLSEVIREGGFQNVRRAAETPFNLILEATG